MIARSGPDGLAVLAAVRAALSRDLDTPAALAAVDAWADAALAGDGTDESAPDIVKNAVDTLLGIEL